jgi:nucleotide-binding universal stress UspA family protein
MPAPLQHVLAATDFSAAAQLAVQRAARIARWHGATLHLLHAVGGGTLEELRSWLGAATPVPEQLLDAARDELAQLAQALGTAAVANDAGLTVSAGTADADRAAVPGALSVACHVGAGSVPAEMLRCAEALLADLVVLGARGAGTLRRLVLGTTADRLLRQLHQPVLVVRNPVQRPYARALVAVDFSRWSAPAVQAARRIVPGVPLVLLAVTQVPFEDKLHFAGVQEPTIAHYRRRARAQALQGLHALAHDLGLPAAAWTPSVMEGEAWQRIVQAEQELGCDLVVLGKQGRSAAEDLLLGSVTRHVLAEGSADLLVCTAPAAAA